MDFSGAFQWANIAFLLRGLGVTVQVALLAIVFSLVIGTLLGVLRYSRIPVLSPLLGLGIDIIRNLPLILIIFFTYFALPKFGVNLGVFWSSVAALTVFESAIISEIIRGGLEAVPKGQTEAGLSQGFSKAQVMRYIILPQGLTAMMPSIVSQLIALIKDTNLATIIALPELTHNARIIYGQNNTYILPIFILMTFMYWVICFGLSKLAKRLSKSDMVAKVSREDQGQVQSLIQE